MAQPQEKQNDIPDEAEWTWLKTHAQRDAVIIVAPKLPLLDAAYEIANDHTDQIQEWIQSGLLSKPTAEQIKAWDQNPVKRFMSLVVQPYVLIQELVLH